MFSTKQLDLICFLIKERVGELVSLFELVEGEDLISLQREQKELEQIYSIVAKMKTK